MTEIRKSDAQLDAEASAPLEERDLTQAIALHRAAYAADLNWLHKLHVRDGEPEPSFCDDPRCLCRKEEGDKTGQTGMAFQHSFQALLDGDLHSFYWSRSMMELRHICRKTHTGHWDRPEWRGSLCHSLVSLVVRHEYGLDMARKELGLADEAKTRRTLGNALLSIERHLDESLRREQQRQSQEPRSPSEWMAAAHVHRPLDGLHREECEQCRRVA